MKTRIDLEVAVGSRENAVTTVIVLEFLSAEIPSSRVSHDATLCVAKGPNDVEDQDVGR